MASTTEIPWKYVVKNSGEAGERTIVLSCSSVQTDDTRIESMSMYPVMDWMVIPAYTAPWATLRIC